MIGDIARFARIVGVRIYTVSAVVVGLETSGAVGTAASAAGRIFCFGCCGSDYEGAEVIQNAIDKVIYSVIYM